MNEHSHARFGILAIYKQTTMWLLHTILSNTTQASTKKGFYMKKKVSILAAHRIVPPNVRIATNKLSLAEAQSMKLDVLCSVGESITCNIFDCQAFANVF